MRQNQLLKTLETVKFSGQLILTSTAEQRWFFYLSQGSSIYVTGGIHAVRRWRRNVTLHCPQMAVHRVTWYFDLAKLPPADLSLGWEYALLKLWISRRNITLEQANKLLHAIGTEVMFEIAQAAEVKEQIHQDKSIASQVAQLKEAPLLHAADAIAEAQLHWQSWQAAMLTSYSPNQAPVIRKPEQLKARSPLLYQNLSSLLNGQHTLYDLAVQLKRDVIEITTSLVPFIQLGWVELINIHDLPAPLLRRDVPHSTPTPAPAASKSAVIACIDDSITVRSMMEELLTSAGYQFVGISDPLRAIGVLLARKPDLIFLDLMMPNANGHEVCQQLRKLSCFRHTPIVILTGSDGYVNRLQSSFVGASNFLAKPLDAKAVFSVIHQYLEQDEKESSVVKGR